MGSEPPGIPELLRIQRRWCERLGSPLYASLLARAAEDAEAGGPAAAILAGHERDPVASALALRLMASVHRLVLAGRAPDLAAFYPSAGGDAASGDPWPAFRRVLEGSGAQLRELVDRPVQTNEPGRSIALMGGLLVVAAETGLSLRLLEIGASAGLNLRLDRYRYEIGGRTVGDVSSPVVFVEPFEEGTPPADANLTIDDRRGCDTSPVDPSTEKGRLTLLSYVWADQVERIRLLRAALDVAATYPVFVDRADGPAWLAGHLAGERRGTATVVLHSMLAQYLGDLGRTRLAEVVDNAAGRASKDSPLAWLRLEPSDERGAGTPELRLTTWPGGRERLLATAHPHGTPVRWLAS